MRSLYRQLLRLHPPRFRDRFEDEMLLVFDDATTGSRRLWLLTDVFASLARQWALRPYYEPAETRRHAVASDGVPTFAMLGQTRPRASALLLGGVLSGVMLSSVILASFFAAPKPHLGKPIVGIDWLWGWNLAQTSPAASPAALRLQEWLHAYNSGDITAMRRFSARNGVGFSEFWSRMFERAGPLQLHSVRQTHGDRITGLARAGNGDWWWIRLQISWDDHHFVRAIAAENLAEAQTPPTD